MEITIKFANGQEEKVNGRLVEATEKANAIINKWQRENGVMMVAVNKVENVWTVSKFF